METGQETQSKEQRQSKKEIDIFSREVLLKNPELRAMIIKAMDFLEAKGVPLPFIHITSSATRSKDGAETSTGFVENIKANGFKPGHTNVGGFILRSDGISIAIPTVYSARPEEFVKEIRLFIHRYGYHGIRTNKDSLATRDDEQVGVPALLLIDGRVPVKHGSDYDNHFILTEGAPADSIIGEINLNGQTNSQDTNAIAFVAESIVQKVSEYYSEEDSGDEVVV